MPGSRPMALIWGNPLRPLLRGFREPGAKGPVEIGGDAVGCAGGESPVLRLPLPVAREGAHLGQGEAPPGLPVPEL